MSLFSVRPINMEASYEPDGQNSSKTFETSFDSEMAEFFSQIN